jgi:very-short-patch-repair endonuclease
MKKDNLHHNNSMWKGASKATFLKAQELRNNMTEPEKMLWERLSNNQLEGFKFRRQHPILFYIADFYCHALLLVIEIDGGYHETDEQKVKDEERTELLRSNKITVIRFTNEAVLNNIDDVIMRISSTISILKNKEAK